MDPQYEANPAVTRVYTAQLVADKSYFATLHWVATPRSGMTPYITFVWTPSYWARWTDTVETFSCQSGGNDVYAPGSSSNANEAWCVFPYANIAVTLFGNKYFAGGWPAGQLPLDGFRWYDWNPTTIASPPPPPVSSYSPSQPPLLPLPSGPGNIYAGTDHLSTNGVLYPNRYIMSGDGRFLLILQGDGNLVEYGLGYQVIWSSGTSGTTPGYAMLQNDGNFVVYNATGTAVWQTSTGGSGATSLNLQADGNLVLYNSTWVAKWTTNTGGHGSGFTAVGSDHLNADTNLTAGTYLQSSNRQFTLVMQTDGNLVLHGPAYGVLWSSNTNGSAATYARMQSDGNLVLYDSSGNAVWNWAAAGSGATKASVQADGNFTLQNTAGTAVKASKTGGQIVNVGSVLNSGGILYPNYYLLSPDTRFVLIQQGDGNLVLYDQRNTVLWQNNKAGQSVAYTTLQAADGNFVEYANGGSAIWAAYSSGGAHLNMQNDGNLVLYNSTWSTAVWQTNTGGH